MKEKKPQRLFGLIFMMAILIIPFLNRDIISPFLSLTIVLLMIYFTFGAMLFCNMIRVRLIKK